MPICKKCFSDFAIHHVWHLVSRPTLCPPCYRALEWHHQITKFQQVPLESFFDYGETFQHYIHQFKTLKDIVLGDVFFNQHFYYLRMKYYGYTLVPAPSHPLDLAARGFHPLEVIWQQSHLPLLHVFEKNQPYRQAEQSRTNRHMIHHIIIRKSKLTLPPKICLIDDVMTSGETLKAMLSLIRIDEVKQLKIVVLARKKPDKYQITSAENNAKIKTWK